MPAEESGKHSFIRDKRVTNFAELWTSLWILGCTGNSLIEIIKDVCACGHVVRMVPSLIILCLGCSPILLIIIFSCHRSNVHWILKVPDMAYCLCCIYFIIFVFFALHQSQDTVLPLGWFFFSKTPLPAKIHDDAFDVTLFPPIKTLRFGAKTQIHQSEPWFQTAQSDLAQKTPLLLITNTAYNAFFSCIWWHRRRRYLEESMKGWEFT